MHPLESIFYMAWRGFAIGVLISAPMGPVGMLCIQRTLDKGKMAGFYTGIGAAISDLIYCLITGFFLSLIEDFLHENQNIIQLVGSVVLIAFSIYLFRKSPSASLRRPISQNVSAKKSILGGFLFTFSNPLIIFLIIGLFARFNFSAPEVNGGFYAVGYVFLVVGALCWWYLVTYLIDKVRSRFNMRSMKLLNMLIGFVILAFACVGMYGSVMGLISQSAKAAVVGIPSYKVYRINPVAVDSTFVVKDNKTEGKYRLKNDSRSPRHVELLDLASLDDADVNPDSVCRFQLDFKLMTDCGTWHLNISDDSEREIDLNIKKDEYWPSPLSSQTAIMVTPVVGGEKVDVRPLADGISAGGLNHFRIVFDSEEGIALMAGNRKLDNEIFIPEGGGKLGPVRSVKITGDAGADITLVSPLLRISPHPSARRSHLPESEIEARIASSNDPIEGRWKVFDYSLEDKNLKSGGDYTVDIVRSPDGIYEIVYHSGGVVNGSAWQRGYVKGLLRSTGHEGVYSLEWRDVEGSTIPMSATMQQESIDILTFHFPEQNSQIRMKRL